MKILIFGGTLLLLASLAVGHAAVGDQAETLDAQRTQALAHTAFPGPMRTYEDCLGQGLLDGQSVSQSSPGCQHLANNEIRLTLGAQQAARFDQEIRQPTRR